MKEAVGVQPLTPEFRTKLGAVFGPDAGVDIPDDAWWAIDYHVDWLFGALSTTLKSEKPFPPYPNEPGQVKGTQEDFDLLIAYERTLIVVEAKAGQNWGNKQVKSKLARLTALVKYNARLPQPVRILFALASPKKPTKLDETACPSALQMKGGGVFWIPLGFGSPGVKHLAVTRCDDGGKRDSDADHWRVREV
ncbi:hypothetical protein [Mesorhizobium sp. M0091]|uniref:hypothetical protein n=1 Tax=Mesorhizobium sp. M0091 TaxID=2956875 RepID=UPI003336F070